MEQKTPEWFQARCGLITASKIADLMATTKSGPSASRENYLVDLALQRLTGTPNDESFTNQAIEDGVEREPLARQWYEAATGNLVEEVGLIKHPTIERSGASPDGLVGDGLIEIKCPIKKTHFATFKNREIPAKYQLQMFWQMDCLGRKWNDFVSFNPEFPANLQGIIIRLEWDEKRINEIREAVIKFDSDVEDALSIMRTML